MADDDALSAAVAAHRTGDLETAKSLYRKALDQDPENAAARHMLGVAERDSGSLKAAERAFTAVLQHDPNNAEVWFDYGLTLRRAGVLDAATDAFSKATAIDPAQGPGWYQLGQCCRTQCRFELAKSAFARAVALMPQEPAVLYDAAQTLLSLGRCRDALDLVQSHEDIILKSPDHAFLRAEALWFCGDTDAAAAAFEQAVHTHPGSVSVRIRYADFLIAQSENEAALQLLHPLRSAHPDRLEYANRLAGLLFSVGRIEDAWPLLRPANERVGSTGLALRRRGQLRWTGQPLDGKRLFLTKYQGLGEQLMFLSLMPDLHALCDIAAAEVDPPLLALAQRTYPGINIVPWSKPAHADISQGEADYWSTAGDFAAAVRRTADDFTHTPPKLLPDASLVDHYARVVREHANGKFVAGLSHASPGSPIGAFKSVPLSQLAWLGDIDDLCLVSLQYGTAGHDLVGWAADTGIDLVPPVDDAILRDPEHQAALIAATDLVMSVSTTTIHIAGAMQHPAWVLLPFGRYTFWYWTESAGAPLWWPAVERVRPPDGTGWAFLKAKLEQEIAG